MKKTFEEPKFNFIAYSQKVLLESNAGDPNAWTDENVDGNAWVRQ